MREAGSQDNDRPEKHVYGRCAERLSVRGLIDSSILFDAPLFGHPSGVDHCATWLEPTALLLLMRRYGYPMRVIETVLSQYTRWPGIALRRGVSTEL